MPFLRKSLVALAAGMALFAGPVCADPASGWSGFYAGIHGGYGAIYTSNVAFDPEGFAGGGQAGFNLQSGRIVFGLEADYTESDIEDTATQTVPVLGAVSLGLEADYMASVRGRLGFTAYDSILLYATGGYAWSEATFSTSVPALGLSAEQGLDYDGIAYGAGVEMKLGSYFTGRVEALRYDLEEKDGAASDLNVGVIRAGLNVLFPVR